MNVRSTLGLGIRLSLGGGWQAIGRVALAAAAVALAVALILGAIGVFAAEDERNRRQGLRAVDVAGEGEPVPDDHLLFAYPGADTFEGRSIKRTLIAVVGDAPLPPWLARAPKPGEMVVSPALAGILSSPDGALLRPRFPGRIIEVLESTWLKEPDELVAYVGAEPAQMSRPLIVMGSGEPRDSAPWSTTIGSVGSPGETTSLDGDRSLTDKLDDPFYQAVLLALIGLLGPIAVFIATAARLSAASREARLAAIRLVGGTPWQVRLAAAGESLTAAVAGCAAGLILFLAGRPVLARFAPDGSSWFPSAIAPSPLVTGLVMVGVPVLAVAVSLLSLRRVVVTPLGVVRRAGRPVRGRWQVAVLAAGLAACALMMVTGEWIFDRRRGAVPIVIVVGAFGLTAVGTVAVAPLVGVRLADLLERTTRGVGFLLASRRLRADPRSAGRIVAGLVVIVFTVGISQAFIEAFATREGDRVSLPLRSSVIRIRSTASDPGDLLTRIATSPGVSAVVPVWTAQVSGPGYENVALVFECNDLVEIVVIRPPTCDATSVFVPPNASTRPSDLALTVRFGRGVKVPIAPLHVVRTPVSFGAQEGLHIPLSALPERAVEGVPPSSVFATTTVGASLDSIRNAFVGFEPPVEIVSADEIRRELSPMAEVYIPQIRAGVELGTLLVLAIAVASMLVATIDGIGERRRTLAMMAVAGTPPRVLRRAVTVEIVMPLLGGILLAVTSSILVMEMFFATDSAPFADQPASIPVAPLVRICLLASGAVAVAALATFPSLSRAIRPDTLRAE